VALISDSDNDINLSSLTIIQPPASGATASIAANGVLSIGYQSLSFTGAENVVIEVCDSDNNCDQSTITITVSNTAPLFSNHATTVTSGGQTVIDLTLLISDEESNVDLSTLSVQQSSSSDASVNLDANHILTISYEGTTFTGSEDILVGVCDVAGACSEGVITITVEGVPSVVVYNAVAPRSEYENTFLRIVNLPASNKVTIFNRWGDIVYETEQYDNHQKRFEGLSQNGKVLPAGTYFYKVEYAEDSKKRQTVTGYLSLKQ
jgi:gliding motility-associated-like protein